jgi:hypothetical protein
MRIILHLDAHEAEFSTDKAGDLHIYAKGLQPDLKPLPRKRGRKPKTTLPQAAMAEGQPGVPYREPPQEDKTKMKTIVMDDQGWQ